MVKQLSMFSASILEYCITQPGDSSDIDIGIEQGYLQYKFIGALAPNQIFSGAEF